MKYKSEIFEVLHQDAAANLEIGAISAAEMREFDEMCLAQESEMAKETAETTKAAHINPVTAEI
jgi:DNA-binding transcriptional regulator YiaG